MGAVTDTREILVLKGIWGRKSLRAIGRELHTSYENIRLIAEELAAWGLVKIDKSIIKANNRELTANGKQELREWKLI